MCTTSIRQTLVSLTPITSVSLQTTVKRHLQTGNPSSTKTTKMGSSAMNYSTDVLSISEADAVIYSEYSTNKLLPTMPLRTMKFKHQCSE